MGDTGLGRGAAASLQPQPDDRLFLKWLENQSEEIQSKITEEKMEELLKKAAQPRHVSGDSCIKLCYFIEQCKSSKSSQIQEIAFSEKTSLNLFNFYIEWNEKNQHRSMRQTLELLSALLARNPDQKTRTAVKASILQRSISIISHQATQPLVKPAFKALECLLSKRTISMEEFIDAYRHHGHKAPSSISTTKTIDLDIAWDCLFSEVFEWMTLADISPAAGKFLVTIFREMSNSFGGTPSQNLTASWQRWIREGISKQPEALENVKNYLFPPLFKLDRPGSLVFLEELNTQSSVWNMKNHEFDAQALLQLAAIEVGKKSGLVEEPSTIQYQKPSKKLIATVVLQEDALSSLLVHASGTVRSLAFSVLVSSNSAIRPFSATALTILQSRLSILYSDTDAKFRNQVLSNTKQMIERLRGATALLVREIESISLQLSSEYSLSPQERELAQVALKQATELLQVHSSFMEWYIEFLLGELIPTSSYQRHITALGAISLLLRSGILKQNPESPRVRDQDNSTVWPCIIEFFNPMSMRLLLDLLLDPFEDVRSSATNILKFASPDNFTAKEPSKECLADIDIAKPASSAKIFFAADQNNFGSELSMRRESESRNERKNKPLLKLRDFIERAEDFSKRTGRADYADGLARSYELLCSLLPSTIEQMQLLTQLVEDLETKVRIAEQDLAAAVLDAPVHGTFAALNFVWSSISYKEIFCVDLHPPQEDTSKYWDSLQLRIVHSCTRVWEVVRDILCDDSPEGHLPDDLDNVEAIDTKEVLSYSFRAVHESSNLLQTILDKTRLRWEESLSPPPSEVFSVIGDLTFLQLSTLRHRGAFSTVSLTFSKCCVLTQVEPQIPTSTLSRLDSWYQGALCCIREQTSTTRRSAGIPALLTAIMSAQATVPSFDQVMAELMTLADHPVQSSVIDSTNLPQVHALNSLKEIFKSTNLGKRSEEYIAECFELAVNSLRSPRWAIRNSGLILLRSIIDRLFGTSDSKAITESGWDGKSIKLLYEAYPKLAELLGNLLKVGSGTDEGLAQPALSVVELVFPALDIIRRAGPPESHRNSIYKSVSLHLGNPVWHVREIAAHTICTLVLNTKWVSSIFDLLETPTTSANRRHGVLLAVKYVLERRFALDPATAIAGVLDLIPILRRNAIQDTRFKSPIIVTNHIEIYNTVALILMSSSDDGSSNEEKLRLDHTKIKFTEITWHLKFPTIEGILPQFYPDASSSSMSFAQCYPALTRLVVYATALRNDHRALLAFLRYIALKDDGLTLAALECIPNAWKCFETFSGLCEACLVALRSSHSGEVCYVARITVAELLDQSFSRSNVDKETIFQALLKILQNTFLLRPNFRQKWLRARIKLGGWIFVAAFNSTSDVAFENFEKEFKVWGSWLAFGGAASSDVDIRYAVASGLYSFYCNLDIRQVKELDCLIPSLLALYTSLNDDDEEIRDLAAKTVSSILKASLAPPAACEEFADWLLMAYNSSSQFSFDVVSRMMSGNTARPSRDQKGPPPRPRGQLAAAENNALFVEEEQNLFVDQVRDLEVWIKLFLELPSQLFKTPCKDDPESFFFVDNFADWVFNEVSGLNQTMTYDGPLGWTSTSLGFSHNIRVIRCANALLKYHDKHFRTSLFYKKSSEQVFPLDRLNSYVGKVISELQKFSREAFNKDIHPMIIQELRAQRLLCPTPGSFPEKISLHFKRIRGINSEQTSPLSQPVSDLEQRI